MNKTVDQFYNKVDPVVIYPKSAEYLKKYWLNEEEYVTHWKQIQDKIFDPKVNQLPARMFLPEFKLMSLLGGATFVEKDFLLLQSCMRVLGEKYFVVIENYTHTCAMQIDKDDIPILSLKFKYPIEITWEEIYMGGFLSEVIMGFWGGREFYVFGESGLWGKYAANDYEAMDIKDLPGLPLAILGFKKECATLFQEKFHNYLTTYEKQVLMKSLSSPSLDAAYKEHQEH